MISIQDTITQTWKEVLNLETVGLDDNFFDVGGTSVQALKIIEQVKSKGISIPFVKMFTCQTIREISEVATIVDNNTNDISNLMKAVHKINDFVPSDEYKAILNDYFKKSESIEYISIPDAKNIFITGATGYLACHLIEQILLNSNTKVYALVRGANSQVATERFWKVFNYYFPNDGYQQKYQDRISIVIGDLTKDRFGLSESEYETLSTEVDSVLHTAGNINHYGVWSDFESINLNGTKRIIEFAKHSTKKRLNHISTISTNYTYNRCENPVPFTEYDILTGEDAENFYIKSKLMAENLVVNEKDTLDIKIFRPSNIIQSYRTGMYPYGTTKDTLFKVNTELTLLNLLAEDNIMLDLPQRLLDFSYIDETAQSIYKLMTIKETDGYMYNIFNPNRMSISEYADRLNLNKLSIEEFEQYLKDHEDTLLGDIKQLCTLSIADGNINQALIVTPENAKTTNLLKDIGFEWHALEDKNLSDIVNFK